LVRRKPNRVALLLSLGVLAMLLAATAAWFFNHFERRSFELRTQMSPAAERNPFLAAERFIQRLGIPVQSLEGRQFLLEPPDVSGLLLVPRLGTELPESAQTALQHWVERGGHLVTQPARCGKLAAPGPDPSLQGRLGVHLECAYLGDSGEASQDGDEEDEIAGDGDEPLSTNLLSEDTQSVQLDLASQGPPAKVEFQQHRLLVDEKGRAYRQGGGQPLDTAREGQCSGGINQPGGKRGQGFHVLQYRLGQGLLTLLSDLDFLDNESIDQADHAYFLAHLTAGAPRVWLLYHIESPALLRLLWDRAPALVLSLAALIGLWLWRLGLYTGPRFDARVTTRRNLLEHLEAMAAFNWRNDRARRLQSASQERLDLAWRRRHPTLERLRRRARCRWLGERLGLDADPVEAALHTQPEQEAEFIAATATLQRLAAGLWKSSSPAPHVAVKPANPIDLSAQEP